MSLPAAKIYQFKITKNILIAKISLIKMTKTGKLKKMKEEASKM
jgi:hypothetical protein